MTDRDQPLITVQGTGIVHAPPDQVTFQFAIAEQQEAYAACLDGLAARVHHLRAGILEAGVSANDLKTGQFSVQPRFEFHEGKQRFTGYEARQQMNLSIPFQKEALGRMLGVLSRSESRAEFEIHFGLANELPAREAALASAVRQAKREAEVLAEAAGTRVGELVEIRSGAEPVIPDGGLQVRMSAMKAEAALEVDPGDLAFRAKATLTWHLVTS